MFYNDEEFFQPAEWTPHQCCWLAWPSHEDLWKESLPWVQKEFLGLCRAIVDIDPKSKKPRGESLEVLVSDQKSLSEAKKALEGLPVRFHEIAFGDIWLRDTAPIFLLNRDKVLGSVRFRFNGWGGKYILPGDSQVAERISARVHVRAFEFPWVLEGGSVEVDGQGTCLTTKQCLLNPNRNPQMTQEQVEEGLYQALGVSQVLWLKRGLINDHTDGHIDTLVRFVAPGVVVCMEPSEQDDPHTEVLQEIIRDLSGMKDAQGRLLQVIKIPSPGKIFSEEGLVLPASYVNFYIGNSTVVVPTYGSPQDEKAVESIAQLFPNRRTKGVSGISILSGGGSFHCITQQQPQSQAQGQKI